ncbi:MAG: diguanylate cyclase (GGDEF)-like protein [Motiliproteus sp.]|jgi:diguanylate cyclase (GGDEF)-like protein
MSIIDPPPSQTEPPQLTQRLAYRQAKWAVLLAFSLGLFFSGLQIYWDYQAQSRSFQNGVTDHLSTLTQPATEALWYLNEDLAKGVIDGLFGFEAVIQGAIVNEAGFVLASQSKPSHSHPHPLAWLIELLFGTTRQIEQPLVLEEDGQRSLIGQLRITVDPHTHGIAFVDRATATLLTGLLRNLILAIGLMLLFYYNFTRQILDISAFLTQLDPSNPHTRPLLTHKNHRRDELGQLVRATNSLICSVSNHWCQRQEAEQALQETNHNLEQTVEVRTQELQAALQELTQQNTHVRLLGQVAAIANTESDPDSALRLSLEQLMFAYNGHRGLVLRYGDWAADTSVSDYQPAPRQQEQEQPTIELTPLPRGLTSAERQTLKRFRQATLISWPPQGEAKRNSHGPTTARLLKNQDDDTLLIIVVKLGTEIVARLAIFVAQPPSRHQETEAVLDNIGSQLALVFERQQHEHRLQTLATTDPLTGILNRRAFEERAKLEFQRARRHHSKLALIMFDVDDFKRINDTYGHAVGDRVLVQLAQTTLLQLRNTDIFGRIGGEEFALVLPECGIDTVWEVAERIRKACQVQSLEVEGHRVSISLGITLLATPDSGIEELLYRADTAQYRAKQSGKNRTWIYASNHEEPQPLL